MKRSNALNALTPIAVCVLTGAAVAASFPGAPARNEDAPVSRLQNTLTIPGSTADQANLDAFRSKMDHIVFIIKENRFFDNYFGTFPGANDARSGVISNGEIILLQHTPDRTPSDLGREWKRGD